MKNLFKILIIILLIIIGVHFYEIFSNQKPIIVLATTTSIYDSGLLDYLLPIFENKYNFRIHVISVGTGQAIEIAKRGDVDLIIVHSKELELDFINSGYGIHRVALMYNDFVIVGPLNDPAEIGKSINAIEAFYRISEAGAKGNTRFISRADKSGTNLLELELWKKIGIIPSSKNQSWYLEANAGMGAVLRMANEKEAYTITDRATWLSYKDQLKNLKILVENDNILLNPYSIILVNPEKFPQRNYKGAIQLAKWMLSEEGQSFIANFRKKDEILFKPIALDFDRARELGYLNQEEEIAWYKAQK